MFFMLTSCSRAQKPVTANKSATELNELWKDKKVLIVYLSWTINTGEHGVAEDRSWHVWHNITLHTGDLNLFKDDATRLMQWGILHDLAAMPFGNYLPGKVAFGI